MIESAEQRPVLTQTARGGKRMAKRPRKMSEVHILVAVNEDGVDVAL